jgi:hypothetical protein
MIRDFAQDVAVDDPFEGLGDFEIDEFAIFRYRLQALWWCIVFSSPLLCRLGVLERI